MYYSISSSIFMKLKINMIVKFNPSNFSPISIVLQRVLFFLLPIILIKLILKKMELPQGENPQIYIDQSATFSGIMRKSERLSHRKNLFEECKHIFSKAHQTRNPSQNGTLLKLLEKSQFLKEIAELVGLDFVKGILKHAKLEIVDERQVIAEEDHPLNYMVVVIEGRLAVQKPSFCLQLPDDEQKEILDNLSLKNADLIEKLTLIAKRQRDQQKRASKLQKKTSFPVSEYQFMLPILSDGDYRRAIQNVESFVSVNQQIGGKQRLNGNTCKGRVFTVEKSVLLVFQMNFLFYWLEAIFKVKLAKNIEKMKTIPAFQIVQQQKLAQIILSMKLQKKKKHEILYSQGEQSEFLYILIEGQLRITKQAQLFIQNPNDFYVDRRKLMRQIKKQDKNTKNLPHKKQSNDDLPYANLSKLYNYRPTKKCIQIGTLSSYGLFGDEEIIFKRNRQATIEVKSLEATYYSIQYKKILQILGKNADKFRQTLQYSLSKKILYRQHQFSDQINFQNRANLNYFYLQEGRNISSPRKVKLQKINDKMQPKTARYSSSNETPAYYTSFNFNKMLKRNSSASQKKEKTKKTTNQSQNDDLFKQIYNPAEQRLVGLSHSWNPIEKKVKQERVISRRISPIKHQINIDQPLIDQQFFKDQAKQQRRINKQFRTIRLSLGQKNK